MGLFGPSKQEISWQRFAIEVGGTFHKHPPSWFHFWDVYKVLVYVKPWTITLDTYETGGEYSMTYTRMCAPYVSDDGFEFNIYFQDFVRTLGKLTLGKIFSVQDIEVGYPEFDREFIIKANEKSKAQELFENARIRHLIQSLMSDRIYFKAEKPVDEPRALCYTEMGTITNVERLKSILELFTETLNQMRKIGSASPIPTSE